jgi:hypothetical protein
MSKSSWMSKIVRFGAMAAGSAAFVAALMVSGGRVAPATAHAAVTPAAEIQVPDELAVGPRSARCSDVDGRACPREGIIIHCANDRGTISQCVCFDGEWTCAF